MWVMILNFRKFYGVFIDIDDFHYSPDFEEEKIEQILVFIIYYLPPFLYSRKDIYVASGR